MPKDGRRGTDGPPSHSPRLGETASAPDVGPAAHQLPPACPGRCHHRHREAGDELVIEVVDDGIGITEKGLAADWPMWSGGPLRAMATVSVVAQQGGSTRLTWRVPLL